MKDHNSHKGSLSLFYKPVAVGLPTVRASCNPSPQELRRRLPTGPLSDRPITSWDDESANYFMAKRTYGAGRKVNAVSDRLGEVGCAEASRLLPCESSFWLHAVLECTLGIYPVGVDHLCKH